MTPGELKAKMDALAAEKQRIDSLSKAYEMVYQDMVGDTPPPSAHPPQTTTESADDSKNTPRVVKKLSKAKVVRDALAGAPDIFSIDDIMEYPPAQNFDRTSVSFILSSMKRKKQIFTVTQGAGAKPSTYAKSEEIQTQAFIDDVKNFL